MEMAKRSLALIITSEVTRMLSGDRFLCMMRLSWRKESPSSTWQATPARAKALQWGRGEMVRKKWYEGQTTTFYMAQAPHEFWKWSHSLSKCLNFTSTNVTLQCPTQVLHCIQTIFNQVCVDPSNVKQCGGKMMKEVLGLLEPLNK